MLFFKYRFEYRLLNAYNQCTNEKERKLMLASIKKLTSNR